MKICFGLSNVICDINDLKFKVLTVRPGAYALLSELKQAGHELILWTRKRRSYVSLLKQENTDIFSFFSEIYCKEDIELWQDIPNCSMHEFKNIKDVQADLLIDCKPKYKEYAGNLNLADKYIIVGDYREDYYKEPNSWRIKMLGDETLDRWKKRVATQEDWIYDVLEKVERESGGKNKT